MGHTYIDHNYMSAIVGGLPRPYWSLDIAITIYAIPI